MIYIIKKKAVLLVDDNRDSFNWGCRGTSIALNQLLSKSFLIANVINKRTVDEPHLISKIGFLSPNLLFSRALMCVERKIKTKFVSNIFLTKSDFIATQSPKSLNNFLRNFNKYPKLFEIYDKVDASDLVIINGEGSMIFTNPPRRDLLFQLFIIELAYYLKKPVYYVNGIVSECPINGINEHTVNYAKDTLSKCEFICVRDPDSYNLAKKLFFNSDIKYVPDALFTWFKLINCKNDILKYGDFIIGSPENNFGKWDFTSPYICIGGSSLAAHYRKESVDQYQILVNTLKNLNINIYLVQSCGGDDFLNTVSELTGVKIIPVTTPVVSGGHILRNAKLFISGRYHPSILASLGGTPCIFLGSNSHKTTSLQKILGLSLIEEFSAMPDKNECAQILEKAKNILENEVKIRQNTLETTLRISNESEKLLDLFDDNYKFV